ncbi:MAG: hypothetical protein LJE69_00685 [Thiohalocapsa sp.]|uniref:hypothetical protein n=1 Tax=Thiohalocapsa sp. TaxID=2497641 RepID=UPI0025FA7C01|nr:hypothetical protein [Thiohalocapsa sp.]MCG6939755.1 hypothetical protein [Thiohalocapsa sp.]
MPACAPLAPLIRQPIEAAGEATRRLAARIRAHAPRFVFTGAGCRTESDIPDCRDEHGRCKGAVPIRYQPFVRDPAARRRHWVRHFAGRPRVAAAAPSATYRTLAALETRGLIAHSTPAARSGTIDHQPRGTLR